MSFHYKADYSGPHDAKGVPMLDYQGHVGLQYNPIAIAQWGLANYNLWCDTNKKEYYKKFIISAQWLCNNLESNLNDQLVWMHHFDWEYRDTLLSPWYSGLAQGQGLSVLTRAYEEEKDKKYKYAAQDALEPFFKSINEGGVTYEDSNRNKWIEEYIVDPPTHILNGFIWALWGLYDYVICFKDNNVKKLYESYVKTLINELDSYDTGYWSLYEHSGTKIKMIASPFYHQLHIIQLQVMYLLTKEKIFKYYSERWSSYSRKKSNKILSLLQKCIFKILYY